MTPLFSKEDFEIIKYTDLLELRCEFCNKVFKQPKSQVCKAIRGLKRVTCNFCSKKCSGLSRRRRQVISCKHCGNEITRQIHEVKSNNFCNHSCSAKYTNSHKTSGTRVSKLEKWLQTKLVSLYPSIIFKFNSRDDIKAELDIYVPELGLAFELNGIFHYEPIYGVDRLTKIQNNDNRKFQACLEHNIELCIIDTSSQRRFTEESSLKYLNIIIGIIKFKLTGC